MAGTDNFEYLKRLIEEQTKNLNKLIAENERLRSTPFDMTSIERIKLLSSEVDEANKKLNDTLKEQRKNIKGLHVRLGNVFKDPSKIIEDTEKIEKKIQSLLKNGKKDEAEKLKNYLDEVTSSASEYYRLANIEQEALNKRIVEGTTALDDFGEDFEQRTRALRKGFGEISNGVSGIYGSIVKTLEPWSKANEEAMKFARTMGMSQKTADAYLKNSVSWASENNIGLLFNKTTDELIQMQNKFSETLGRNVQLTGEQKKDMLAMEKFLGEDGMVDIANNLENFGLVLSDSAEFIKETMDEATKSGIAASKLTKTIRENIKMAQNYTFKNGLEGLSSMAKKAIELKTDLSLINGFLDKTSTVEGAITTGANLQVLGGNYAMASNPLSMMYESLNDMEGLFDRAVNMAKGKVFYNNKTGNFEMGAMDRYLMKQAATVMGVDPTKMIDVAFRQASLGKIEQQAKENSNISNDKDMIELIKNVATWNNGEAVVRIDGKDKKVSDLTSEDKAKLEQSQKTDSQNLQEMAISLRSINDVLSGTTKEINNEQADMLKGIGEGITNLLKDSTSFLNVVAQIGSVLNILSGAKGIAAGVWMTAIGVARLGGGFRNIFTGRGLNGAVGNTNTRNVASRGFGSRIFGNRFKHAEETIVSQKSTGKKFIERGGKYYDYSTGKEVTNGRTLNSMKNANFVGKRFNKKILAKAIGKSAGLGAAAGGLISIGSDVISGEFKKDRGGSIGRAVGTSIGAAIGGIAGPVGAMIGGFVGSVVTGSIQDAQKRHRNKFRKEIADNLYASMPQLASLFDGENAIQGNYSKKQLKKIQNALSDGTLDEDELSGSLIKKLKANDDLKRIQNAGMKLNVEMANGGVLSNNNTYSNSISHLYKNYANGGKLEGNSHANGGMPILGSNIVVEGGEYVVNKEATKLNLPLLDKINSGDYKIKAIEPLGKQMKVNENRNFSGSSIQNSSNIDIKPISINLSGTIKLDTGNKQFDISDDIINNPMLIKKLTEMINKQINILDNGSYNKNSFKQKFV